MFNQSRGRNMKQTRLVKILAAGAACAAAFGLALAQDTSTTTTTEGSTGVSTTSTSTLNGSGTIATYTPGSDYIMFRTEASAEPVKYYYSKNTTVVDPEGAGVKFRLGHVRQPTDRRTSAPASPRKSLVERERRLIQDASPQK